MELIAGLYIIATPIGNLADITLRAIIALTNCDIIFCEDTRFTKKLLAKHQIINKNLAVYNDHSTEEVRLKIANLIKEGKKVGLVSDAGTPLIADPGYKLVRYLQEQNLHIDVIPGPCAAITALVLSGLATDSFYFAGFVPKTGREKFFQKLKNITGTLIFYDTAPRIADSLAVANKVFGNRDAAIVREITKIYQTTYFQPLMELSNYINANPIKGEIVWLVSGKNAEDDQLSIEELADKVMELKHKGLSSKDAIVMVIEKYPGTIGKKELYQFIHKQ